MYLILTFRDGSPSARRQNESGVGTGRHLRCLLKIKYKHHDRHSIPVTSWAKRKASEISRGLLEGAGLEAEADGLAVSLKWVSLGERGSSSFILYDVCLERCTSEAREQIERSNRQPIHVISKRSDVGPADSTMRRSRRLMLLLLQSRAACYPDIMAR